MRIAVKEFIIGSFSGLFFVWHKVITLTNHDLSSIDQNSVEL